MTIVCQKFGRVRGLPSRYSLSTNFGFTLIELMVVVAIIGVLSKIGMTKYETSSRRSRQAEAKLAVTGIYALEKAFYSEYNAYAPSFDAIGFAVEGLKRWYITSVCFDHTAGIYSNTITGYSGVFTNFFSLNANTPAYAAVAVGGGCTTAYPTFALVSCDVQYATSNPQFFFAIAKAQLCEGCQRDVWIINETKMLRNCNIGTQ